jgi:hypothetical protein
MPYNGAVDTRLPLGGNFYRLSEIKKGETGEAAFWMPVAMFKGKLPAVVLGNVTEVWLSGATGKDGRLDQYKVWNPKLGQRIQFIAEVRTKAPPKAPEKRSCQRQPSRPHARQVTERGHDGVQLHCVQRGRGRIVPGLDRRMRRAQSDEPSHALIPQAAPNEQAEERRKVEARAAEERQAAAKRKAEHEAAIDKAKWHTWTSADGQHKIEANFMNAIDDTDQLEKKDGTIIKIKRDRLSGEDWTWITNKSWNNPD